MKNRTSTSTESPTVTAPICWQREALSACLRIELLNGEIHLFPYTHLAAARLTRNGEESETLRLVFSTHEIQIDGHNLRDLVLGIQDLAIKWLRAAPEKYHSLASSRDADIVSVRVTTVE